MIARVHWVGLVLGLGACTRVTTPPPEPPAAPLDVAQAQAELDGAIEAGERAATEVLGG